MLKSYLTKTSKFKQIISQSYLKEKIPLETNYQHNLILTPNTIPNNSYLSIETCIFLSKLDLLEWFSIFTNISKIA